jgi:hypothetical protein
MVRLGIAAAITTLAGVGAFASGCSSDDNGSGGGTTADGGQEDTGTVPVTDGGGSDAPVTTGDSASDAPVTTVLPDAKLILLHAAPGVGPIRLCIAQSEGTAAPSVAPIAAIPDNPADVPPWTPPPAYGPAYDGGVGAVAPGTPGLYPGTIAAVPDITTLANLNITPFVIDANLIADQTSVKGPDGGKEATCDILIGKHGLGTGDTPPGILSTSQFIQLPTVPANTLLDGTTWLLSATGCLPGFQPSASAQALGITAADTCGAGYDGGSNVALGLAKLDTTTQVDGGWGIQFAQRSTAIQGTPFPLVEDNSVIIEHAPASDGLLPGVVVTQTTTLDAGADDAGDGGDASVPTTTTTQSFVPIATTPVAESPTALTPVATVTANPATSAFGFLTAPGSLDGGAFAPTAYPYSSQGETVVLGDTFAIPLTSIEALSSWTASTEQPTPATFVAGQTYTLITVGNNDLTVPQLLTAAGTSNLGGDAGACGSAGCYDGRGLHIVAFPNSFTAIPQQ